MVAVLLAACTEQASDDGAPGSSGTTSNGSSSGATAGSGGHAGASNSTGVGAGPFDEDCSNVDTDTTKSFIPDELVDLTAQAQSLTAGGIQLDFVAFQLPYPDGKTWSIWGRGELASNGMLYATVGDHDSGGDGNAYDGNSFLYQYDPSTKSLRAVGDALSAFGQHVAGENGYGKIHGRVNEGPCGILYLHTYWGSASKVVYQGNYQGDLLLRYNPYTKHLESLGVLIPHTGTPSSNLWRAGGLFYGEANAPGDGDGNKEVSFWAYDIPSGTIAFQGAPRNRRNRNIAVDLQGRAYTADDGAGLYRYDPMTQTEEALSTSFDNGGWLRASTAPDGDGHITMVTHSPHAFYDFDPDAGTLTHLANASDYVADIASDPTGQVAYYVPGAHGNSLEFPLMEVHRKTGAVRTIVELGDAIEGAGGTRPTGTYSINVSGDGKQIFLAANGGDKNGFGSPLVVVVHLPEAELP